MAGATARTVVPTTLSGMPTAAEAATGTDVFSRAALSPHVAGPLRDAVCSARARVVDRDRFGVSDDAVNDAAMTHSWLFTGPPGSGRSVAARAFATALVCSDPTAAGCGDCEGCRSAAAGSHPDITWIRTDGVTIPVDEVREIIRTSAVLPSVARWRIVIVEDADRLGDSGANALLKSVEEPPAHTVFLLCAPSTDPEDISITLRSRCRHIYVPTPSKQEVEAVLEADRELGLTAEQAHWAADVSGGHIGRARHLASDEAARTKRATALKLPGLIYESGAGYRFTAELVKTATDEAAAACAPRDTRELAELESSLGMGARGRGVARATTGSAGQIKELEKMQKNRRTRMLRDSLDLALIDIAGLYRDAMMIAVGALEDSRPVGGFLHPDQEKVSRELARRNSPEDLVRCMDAVSDCREMLGRNVKPEVALTGMVGRLRECCRQV